MPNNEIDPSKPHVRVGTIGSNGKGETAVTDALARVAAETGWTHVKFGSDIAAADVAILVVSAVDGPSPDVRAQLLLAREANVPHLVAALYEVDKVDDPELIDLVELEVRELVRQCGYPSDLAVVHLSAFSALQGHTRGVTGVMRLMDALDECVASPLTRRR